MMMSRCRHFTSDVSTLLVGTGARVTFLDFSSGETHNVTLHEFLHRKGAAAVPDERVLIHTIFVPVLWRSEHYRSYRTALRSHFAHALVNAAMRVRLDDHGIVMEANFVFGCVGDAADFAHGAEKVR